MITRNFGSYGRQYQVDEEGREIVKKVEKQKRSHRGRPKKNEISEGSVFAVSPLLYHAFGLL